MKEKKFDVLFMHELKSLDQIRNDLLLELKKEKGEEKKIKYGNTDIN